MEEIVKIIREFPWTNNQEDLEKLLSFFKAQAISISPLLEDKKPSGIIIDFGSDLSIAFYNNFCLADYDKEAPKILLVIYVGNSVYWHRCLADYSVVDQGEQKLHLIISDALAYVECGGLVKDFQKAELGFDLISIFSEARNYRKFSSTDKISVLGVKTNRAIWEIIYIMGGNKIGEGKIVEPSIADLLKANPAKEYQGVPFGPLAFLEKGHHLLVDSLKIIHKLREKLLLAYYLPTDGPFLLYGSLEYYLKKVKEHGITEAEAKIAINIASTMKWIKII